MKYQAPPGVTALFCAGAETTPDENGVFDAPETTADELAAHGCVVHPERAPAASEKSGENRPRSARARAGKAD